MKISKGFMRFLKKSRRAIILVLASVFFGFLLTGVTNLAPIGNNPWVNILVGFFGLVALSWFGIGPLINKK